MLMQELKTSLSFSNSLSHTQTHTQTTVWSLEQQKGSILFLISFLLYTSSSSSTGQEQVYSQQQNKEKSVTTDFKTVSLSGIFSVLLYDFKPNDYDLFCFNGTLYCLIIIFWSFLNRYL